MTVSEQGPGQRRRRGPEQGYGDGAAQGADGRDESRAERYDRNWNEVLQELRVLQTGTQILTGFLLALAFQPGFADLDDGQRMLYLALVVLAAVSTIVALAPVALHRALFRKHAKRDVVAYGHGALITALITVSLLVIGVVAFIFGFVLGPTASWISAVGVAIVVVLLWIAGPAAFRLRLERTR